MIPQDTLDGRSVRNGPVTSCQQILRDRQHHIPVQRSQKIRNGSYSSVVSEIVTQTRACSLLEGANCSWSQTLLIEMQGEARLTIV